MPEVKSIPYRRSDGKDKVSSIIPIEFSINGLSEQELTILSKLSNAVSALTPIYATQQSVQTITLFKLLEEFENGIQDPILQEKISDYLTLLAVKNSPFDMFDFTMLFPSVPDRKELEEQHLGNLISLVDGIQKPTKGRSLYPADITEAEFEIVKPRLTSNSTVVRDKDGKIVVRRNEKRFKKELEPVISSLEEALELARAYDNGLSNYIAAKIEEMKTGTKKATRASDLAWLKNESNLDFVLGTGVETYLDKFKGVLGVAQGLVLRVNQDYNELAKELLNILPELEAKAPWKHKKEVDPEKLPRLSYADVLVWSGGYNVFPMAVMAESLPNDKFVIDNFGSVNLNLVNIQEARTKFGGGQILRKEFFMESEMNKYEQYMPKMGILMTAEHELGHTTGGTTYKEDAHERFGANHSIMEEARAELFSMWCLPTLVEHGIITPDEEVAGYYSMIQGIITNLQLAPNDHSGSRNMMFHYFLKEGAIEEVVEEKSSRYIVKPAETRVVVAKMLGEIGDLKAAGDVGAVKEYYSRYISTARQAEFEKRLENLPLGVGFIFPELVHNGEKFTGELSYPQEFRDQMRTLGHFD